MKGARARGVDEITSLFSKLSIGYRNLEDIQRSISDEKWIVKKTDTSLQLSLLDASTINGMYGARTITINRDLTYQVTYRDRIIRVYDSSDKVTDINKLMLQVKLLNVCPGIPGGIYIGFHNPQKTTIDNIGENKVLRSIHCQQLGQFPKVSSKCDDCNRIFRSARKQIIRKGHISQNTMAKRAKRDNQTDRQIRSLQGKASYYKKEACKAKDLIELAQEDHSDTVNIFEEIDCNITEHNFTEDMQLLWEAQRENVKGRRNRWHPK